MVQKSPALSRSASGPCSNPSQASFSSTTRPLLQADINVEYNLLRTKAASISCIRWACPPKFILNNDWYVVAGDQSEERRIQEQRCAAVTEVIYQHPSAIPSSPLIVMDMEEGHSNDGFNPPIIPTTPVEYEVDSSNPCTEGKHLFGTSTDLEADIGAAAFATFTALIKSNEQGSLIDTDLLIKILSDPKMIDLLKNARSFDNENSDRQSALNINDPMKEGSVKLPTKMQLTAEILESMELLLSNSVVPSVSPPTPVLDTMLLLKQVCENPDSLLKHEARIASDLMNFVSVDIAVPKSEQTPQKIENLVQKSFSPGFSADKSYSSGKTRQPIRDANYYKSLVKQHGVEKREVYSRHHISGQFGCQLRETVRQVHGKSYGSSPKPCMYFNSPKGCRLGLNCPYRHEFSSNQMRARSVSEPPRAKRFKFNRGVILRL